MNINNKSELEEKLINSKEIFLKNGKLIKSRIGRSKTQEIPFVNSKIEIDFIDYYFTNHIARSSMTMGECRSTKNKFKATETEV